VTAPRPVYIRSMAVAMAPMTVGCTRCLVGRGSHCRSKGGYQNSAVGFHKARRDAVAHLSEQQRYDAYAAMRAEEAELRASVEASLRRPLTSAQVESRRRTGAAWDRIGREVAAEVRAARPRLRVLSGRAPLSPARVARLDDYRPRHDGGPSDGGAA
jgi:hypothetical protein